MRGSKTSSSAVLQMSTKVQEDDAVEARWAADAIAQLARQLEPNSVAAIVLKRTQRELQSLAQSAEECPTGTDSHVIGPIRLRVAG